MSWMQARPGDPINRRHPHARGLVGFWPFNEPGGFNVAYDYGPFKTHAIQNTSFNQPAFVTSERGRARSFVTAGVDDFMDTGSTVITTLNNFTVMCWVRTTDTFARAMIIWAGDSAGNGGGNEDEFHLSFGDVTAADKDQIQVFFGSTGASSAVINYSVTPSDFENVWRHLTVVVEDAATSAPTVYLYVDAVEVASDTGSVGTNFANWDTGIRFGRPGADTRYYDGQLQDVRLYNRRLRSREIASVFADPNAIWRRSRSKGIVAVVPTAAGPLLDGGKLVNKGILQGRLVG